MFVRIVSASLLAASAAADARTVASAPSGCSSAIARTVPILQAADVSLARGDSQRANARFDLALSNLGSAYRRRGLLDDSGMKLVLASAEENKGRLTKAAGIKRRVLESRLQLCGYRPK